MLSIDFRHAVKTTSQSYHCNLFRLIMSADSENTKKLSSMYPIEVEMVRIYQYECIYRDQNRTEVDWDAIEEQATINVTDIENRVDL